VELVGPAGAGKSTLAKGVTAVDRSVRSGLSLWGLPRRQLIRSALTLVPTMIGAGLKRARLRAGELAQLIRLDALRHVVVHEASRHRVIILDEGPIFALSWLDVFFARAGDRAPAAWRQRVITDWASLLDVVVFIDPSDIVAARPAEAQDVVGFSAGFRRALERAISDLAHGGGHFVVDTLQTELHPADENTAALMSKLKQRRNGH
jgi:energy-coupling factor transporter ATP-binding protein EcfA2